MSTSVSCQVMQRRSVFPPLLMPANGVPADKNPSIKQRTGREKANTKQKTIESCAKDIELQKKQRTRAEALVRKWDSLLVREREDRHALLLQRLDLQRKLISKNDLAFHESLKAADEKKAQEIKSWKEKQQRMIRELRAHSKKIAEHKKMVAEKVLSRNLSRCASLRPTERVVSPELSHLMMEQNRGEEEDEGENDNGGRQADGDFPTDSGHTSRLQQLLDFDPLREPTPTISHAWTMLKHEHTRKLQPILEYSSHTRESANPTARVLLKCYDQPIRMSTSGERVPLSDMVEEETERIQANFGRETLLARAIHQRTHRYQAKSETLLHNKQAQVDVPIQEPTMYLPTEEYKLLDSQTLPRYSPQPPKPEYATKHTNIHQTLSKNSRMPKYLGADSSVEASRCEVEKNEEIPTESAFLTDGEVKESKFLPNNRKGRWQPLSFTAVTEYDGTSVLPAKVFSSKAHGRYSLWKPLLSHH